jgi:hypothetical protein
MNGGYRSGRTDAKVSPLALLGAVYQSLNQLIQLAPDFVHNILILLALARRIVC